MLRYRGYLSERTELLTVSRVEKFRKDFLVLMKNVKKLLVLKDVKEIDRWRTAVVKWGTSFEDLMGQIKREIEARLRVQIGKPEFEKPVNEYDAKFLLRKMKTVWDFSFEMTSPPGSPLSYYMDYNRREGKKWWTDERIFQRFSDDIKTWERRVRDKSRKAWRWLKEMAKWTQRTGLNSGGGEAISLNAPDNRNISLEGFEVQLKNYIDTEINDRMVRDLKNGLKVYKQRASRVFPQMLKATRPFVIDFEGGHGSYAATYSPNYIEVNIWGALGKPKEVARLIAHEMGHHIWRAFLHPSAQSAWGSFIRGSVMKLDLRSVVRKWGDIDERELKKKDPILYIQLSTLLHDPAYKHLDILGMAGIQKYLDKGGDPIIHVTSKPITGYAGKNTEEAFCEALSMLVGYGPRAVLSEVRWMLKSILPKLKVEGKNFRDGDAMLRQRGYLKEKKGEADFYKFLYRKNKGIFYRGSGRGGKGVGMGAIGAGVYLTWNKGMAKAFAQHHGQGGQVEAYEVKPGLKMLDSKSKLITDLKAEMGFDPWEYTDSPMFAKAITVMAKEAGFDGVVSDNLADGLVVFDSRNVKKVVV